MFQVSLQFSDGSVKAQFGFKFLRGSIIEFETLKNGPKWEKDCVFNLFLGWVYKTEKLKSIIRDQSLTLYTKINDKNFQGGEKGVFYKKPEQETFVTNRILVAFYFGKNSKHRQQQRHFIYKKLKSLHLYTLRKKNVKMIFISFFVICTF